MTDSVNYQAVVAGGMIGGAVSCALFYPLQLAEAIEQLHPQVPLVASTAWHAATKADASDTNTSKVASASQPLQPQGSKLRRRNAGQDSAEPPTQHDSNAHTPQPAVGGITAVATVVWWLYAVSGNRRLGSLWRGSGAYIAGACVNWGVYFSVMHLLLAVGASLADALGIHTPSGVASELARDFVACALAGCITCCIVNPFWVLGVRHVSDIAATLELDGTHHKAATSSSRSGEPWFWQRARTIISEEGVVALWSGVRASMAGCFEGALQITLYGALKRQLHLDDQVLALFVIGCLTRAAAVTATYPYQVVRSHIIVAQQSPKDSTAGPKTTSARAIIAHVLAQHGVAGMYAGLTANLLRQTPAAGVCLAVNELVQLAMA